MSDGLVPAHLAEANTMACATCKQALNKFTHGGDEVQYVHARFWEEYDHDPVPVSARTVGGIAMACDFCGEMNVRWFYYGTHMTIAAQDEKGKIHDPSRTSGRWSCCDGCDRYAKRGDVEGLMAQVGESSKAIQAVFGDVVDDKKSELLLDTRRHMWTAYLRTVTRRELIPPPPPPPARLRPRDMPKIRDRLVKFYNGPIAPMALTRTHEVDEVVVLPGVVLGMDDVFIARVEQVGRETAERFCRHMVAGLEVSDLYWISGDFTVLAASAARELPDISVTPEEMPSKHGLVVWEKPILSLADPLGRDVFVVAASWTLIPKGIWVSVYVQPEQTMTDIDRSYLREEMGYLVPFSTGGGAMFGRHQDNEQHQSRFLRTLLSTWFLMMQPGVATESRPALDKATVRNYRNAGRPEPSVRVVDLRRHAQQPQDRESTGEGRKISVRFLVHGHWKRQAYGPGRSLRKTIYIAPFMKGPDGAPLKTDDVPTVKVLR